MIFSVCNDSINKYSKCGKRAAQPTVNCGDLLLIDRMYQPTYPRHNSGMSHIRYRRPRRSRHINVWLREGIIREITVINFNGRTYSGFNQLGTSPITQNFHSRIHSLELSRSPGLRHSTCTTEPSITIECVEENLIPRAQLLEGPNYRISIIRNTIYWKFKELFFLSAAFLSLQWKRHRKINDNFNATLPLIGRLFCVEFVRCSNVNWICEQST